MRFKIETGADVTIIAKKTWLAMKDKPRLEPTAVRLNSVDGQLKAFGQFVAVTKHRNTVYRINVIVIEGEKMTNLLSRDVAADMVLVCRQEQVIRSVTELADCCTAMVPVIKKTGAVRVRVDLKQLNAAVRREHHMLPSLSDIAPKHAESKVFSTLDAARGSWQIQIDEDSQLLTTVIRPFGRYAFCRLPFGISSVPEIFQCKTSTLLEGLDGVEVIITYWFMVVTEKNTTLVSMLS